MDEDVKTGSHGTKSKGKWHKGFVIQAITKIDKSLLKFGKWS